MRNKHFYYLRSGVLHHVYPVDYAVNLSEDEDRQIKEELNKEPYNKQEILEKYWSFLTRTAGKKSYDFVSYMDKKCALKRAEGRRNEKREH